MKSKIRYGNTVILYTIVKSKRRKTSEIRINETGVEIRTPITKKDSEIQKIIHVKKQWIFKKQLEYKDQNRQRSKNLYKNSLMYFGKEIPLEIKTKQKTEGILHSRENFLINLITKYSKPKVKKLYDGCLFEKATGYLPRRTHNFIQNRHKAIKNSCKTT